MVERSMDFIIQLIVLYGVDPSDVRHQRGCFEEAFRKHQEIFGQHNDRVQRWRDALTQVSSYSGWDSKGQHEASLVENIAQHIHRKLVPKFPSCTENLVGISSKVDQVNKLIESYAIPPELCNHELACYLFSRNGKKLISTRRLPPMDPCSPHLYILYLSIDQFSDEILKDDFWSDIEFALKCYCCNSLQVVRCGWLPFARRNMCSLNDRADIIHNDQGNRTTPSFDAFADSKRLISNAAKNQAASNPTNTIVDAKRLIGRRYSDSIIQNDIKLWPFTVICWY
ncbi:hypothetical protein P8452_60835 [Trifolium repens]|nr:hypothetical protein P8452_60835 [Trifolium repens]